MNYSHRNICYDIFVYNRLYLISSFINIKETHLGTLFPLKASVLSEWPAVVLLVFVRLEISVSVWPEAPGGILLSQRSLLWSAFLQHRWKPWLPHAWPSSATQAGAHGSEQIHTHKKHNNYNQEFNLLFPFFILQRLVAKSTHTHTPAGPPDIDFVWWDLKICV